VAGPVAGRPPFPVGWFVVARLDEVPDGALAPLAAFGQDLAVGRTASGRALVTHSVCPHLGADLAAGGRIDDDQVVCPLHEWCFSHAGACTSAADGPIPETARLRVWPTGVGDGLVWAFNGRDGEEPPAPPPGAGGPFGEPEPWQAAECPGHPEDVLVGWLLAAGVVDGVAAEPTDGEQAGGGDAWVGSTADGLRVTARGPGTLAVSLPDGAEGSVHVTPVDGFTVVVRRVGDVPGADLSGIAGPGAGDLPTFRDWYRRFDRSTVPSRRPVRSGRSGRRSRRAGPDGQEPRPTNPSNP